MPSEEIPPLAPFPELSSALAEAGVVPARESSLLSEAQRRELAQAADSLTGRATPPAAAEAINAADDFLLGEPVEKGSSGGFAMKMDVPEEETAEKIDFLDTSGEASAVDDAFSLQSLAASLTMPAPQPAAVPAAGSRRRDGWEPPLVPAFPSLTAVASTATGASAPPSVKKEAFFAASPSMETEPVALFPPPRALEPEPETDFDAPLLFPVPSSESHGDYAGPTEPDPHDRALSAILCGALLIVLGLFLACIVPHLALEADAAAGSANEALVLRAGHLRGGMLFSVAGAAACLALGIGATTLRRWAPPLIHAGGWAVLLTVLGGMAVATASMFRLSANNTPGDAVPGDSTAIFVAAGLLGVALPLLLIGVFQRPGIARLCALADNRPRWTDGRSVPALMIFIGSAILATASFAMSIAGSAFPAFGNLITGAGAWAGTGITAAAAAGLAAAGRQAGWWLFTGFASALTAGIFLTCRQHAWQEMFGHSVSLSPTVTDAVLAAAAMLPSLLIALMSRHAMGRPHAH